MHNSTIQICTFFYLNQSIEYIHAVLVSTQNRLCFQSKLHTLLLLGILNWYCCWWMGWLIVAGVGWLIMGATSASCNKTVWALILHINIQITLQLNSNARSLNASWNQLQSECFKDLPKEIWIWTQFLNLQATQLSALGPEFYLLNWIELSLELHSIVYWLLSTELKPQIKLM